MAPDDSECLPKPGCWYDATAHVFYITYNTIPKQSTVEAYIRIGAACLTVKAMDGRTVGFACAVMFCALVGLSRVKCAVFPAAKQACGAIIAPLNASQALRSSTYIVMLRKSASSRDVLKLASLLHGVPGGESDSRDATSIRILHGGRQGFVVTSTARRLRKLCSDSRVEMLLEDAPVFQSDDISEHLVPYHLDRLDQQRLPLDHKYRPAANGSGVEVFVLDSGINYDHNEFEGRASYGGYDVVDETDPWRRKRRGRDCLGHGTAVASIVGGRTVGVAPGTTLRSVRVLSCSQYGSVANTILGLDFIIDLKKRNPSRKIAVVCSLLSYGNRRDLDSVIEEASLAGIPVIVAAGNYRKDACFYSPASSPYAITVGATNKDDAVYGNSNFGRCIDVMAPGDLIPGAGFPCLSCLVNHSGTSFAAPVVAGVVAVTMQQDGGLSPDEIKSKLVRNCNRGVLDFGTIPKEYQSTTPNCLVSTPRQFPYVVKMQVGVSQLKSVLVNHSLSGYLPTHISSTLATPQKENHDPSNSLNVIFKLVKNAKNAHFYCERSSRAVVKLLQSAKEQGLVVTTFRSFIRMGRKLRFVLVAQPLADVGYATTLHMRLRQSAIRHRLNQFHGHTPIFLSATQCQRKRAVFTALAKLHSPLNRISDSYNLTEVSAASPAYRVVQSVNSSALDAIITQQYQMGYFLKDIDVYHDCWRRNASHSSSNHVLLFHRISGIRQKYQWFFWSGSDFDAKMADFIQKGRKPILIGQVSSETYLVEFAMQ